MLSALLLAPLLSPTAAADAACTPPEGQASQFRIVSVQRVPASSDEEGDCSSGHTMVSAVVVKDGVACTNALQGSVAFPNDADAAAGREFVGSHSQGGQCWPEFYVSEVLPAPQQYRIVSAQFVPASDEGDCAQPHAMLTVVERSDTEQERPMVGGVLRSASETAELVGQVFVGSIDNGGQCWPEIKIERLIAP